jgi:hypothetical protein
LNSADEQLRRQEGLPRSDPFGAGLLPTIIATCRWALTDSRADRSRHNKDGWPRPAPVTRVMALLAEVLGA